MRQPFARVFVRKGSAGVLEDFATAIWRNAFREIGNRTEQGEVIRFFDYAVIGATL